MEMFKFVRKRAKPRQSVKRQINRLDDASAKDVTIAYRRHGVIQIRKDNVPRRYSAADIYVYLSTT